MEMKKILGITILVGVILALALIACESPMTGRGPPRMEDESPIAPNPSRAVARAGETAEINIPDYLLPAASPSIRAVTNVNATFRVHPDDAHIAEIVGPNTGSACNVKGKQLGSARIIIKVGDREATVIIAVSPSDGFYKVPATEERQIGEQVFQKAWWVSDQPDDLPDDFSGYTADSAYQLAWKWRNPSPNFWDNYGASDTNCGIDVMSYFVDPTKADRRGWVRTTFDFGGWFYNLNGVTDKMTNGEQTEGNVTLKLKPEFIYDNGVPYLQITHTLTNNGTSRLTGQKFGASADVMIINMDKAPLTYMDYGALMTNENISSSGTTYLPTLKLRLICQNFEGVDNTTTLWLGRWASGDHRDHLYEDNRVSITARDKIDTALSFSYQNITLEPRQSKTFVVRFTQIQ